MTHQTFFKGDTPTRFDRAKDKALKEDANWRNVSRIVDARDGRACRACGKKTDADAVGLLRGHRHHIVYRSAGGEDASYNVVTLCAACHDAEHVKRTLSIEGNADEALIFWRKGDDKVWTMWRRELAVRRFERD